MQNKAKKFNSQSRLQMDFIKRMFVILIFSLATAIFISCGESDLINSVVNSKTERIEIRNETKDTSIKKFISINDIPEIKIIKNYFINIKKTNRKYNTKGNLGAIEISLIDANNKSITLRNIKTDQGYVMRDGKNSYEGDSLYQYIRNEY